MGIRKTITLKELNTRKTKLQSKFDVLVKEREDLNNRIDMLGAQLNDIQKQIENISDMQPRVSEHALLRYLERKKGIDLHEIREEILTDKLKKQIEVLHSGKIPMGDFVAIVQNKTIVSITSNN